MTSRQWEVYQTSTDCQPLTPAPGAFRPGLLPLRHSLRDGHDIPIIRQ